MRAWVAASRSAWVSWAWLGLFSSHGQILGHVGKMKLGYYPQSRVSQIHCLNRSLRVAGVRRLRWWLAGAWGLYQLRASLAIGFLGICRYFWHEFLSGFGFKVWRWQRRNPWVACPNAPMRGDCRAVGSIIHRGNHHVKTAGAMGPSFFGQHPHRGSVGASNDAEAMRISS